MSEGDAHPGDPQLARFVHIVAEILGLPAIDPRREVSDCGFDSVAFYALANAMSRQFDVSVSPVDMFACRTIYDIYRLLPAIDPGAETVR